MKRTNRVIISERGGTATELLVAVLILGLLVMVVLLSWTVSKEKSREAACRNKIKQLSAAISSYARENAGARPESLEALVPKYLPAGFSWKCPAGNYGKVAADYRDDYDTKTGRVTCPWPKHGT